MARPGSNPAPAQQEKTKMDDKHTIATYINRATDAFIISQSPEPTGDLARYFISRKVPATVNTFSLKAWVC